MEHPVLHRQVAHRFKEALNPDGEGYQHPPVQTTVLNQNSTHQYNSKAHANADQELYHRLQTTGKPAGL